MANFTLIFGQGNAASFSGLSPTFLTFKETVSGTNVTAPGITETPTGTGLYYFSYSPTLSISFTADGNSNTLAGPNRYISGQIDPIQQIQPSVATLVAGMTALLASIGSTASTFGGVSTVPFDLFGYLKRSYEFWEGDSTFTKSTGVWNVSSHGASFLLATKTLTDTATAVTKT